MISIYKLKLNTELNKAKIRLIYMVHRRMTLKLNDSLPSPGVNELVFTLANSVFPNTYMDKYYFVNIKYEFEGDSSNKGNRKGP